MFIKSATFLIDLDEKRNGVFSLFWFFLKNDKDVHQKCYFFIDFDEKHNGFFIFLKLCNKDMQYRYATQILNTDMQCIYNRYAIKICNTDMQ